MTSPTDRVHDATRRLLDLLEHGEATSVEALELRIELALATAQAGHLEDAFYQADELLKDAQRTHGPQAPIVGRVREAVDRIEVIARGEVEETDPAAQA